MNFYNVHTVICRSIILSTEARPVITRRCSHHRHTPTSATGDRRCYHYIPVYTEQFAGHALDRHPACDNQTALPFAAEPLPLNGRALLRWFAVTKDVRARLEDFDDGRASARGSTNHHRGDPLSAHTRGFVCEVRVITVLVRLVVTSQQRTVLEWNQQASKQASERVSHRALNICRIIYRTGCKHTLLVLS